MQRSLTLRSSICLATLRVVLSSGTATAAPGCTPPAPAASLLVAPTSCCTLATCPEGSRSACCST